MRDCLVYPLLCDFCGIASGKDRVIWFSELMG